MSAAGRIRLCGFAIGELAGAAAPAIALFVLMWEVMLWRAVLVGVYISDDGIKFALCFTRGGVGYTVRINGDIPRAGTPISNKCRRRGQRIGQHSRPHDRTVSGMSG